MLDDWGLGAIVNPFLPTIDASTMASNTTTTITSAIPPNNNQMLNDWGQDVMVNNYPFTIEGSIPSFTDDPNDITTSTPTTTLANNNQMLGGWGLDAIANDFYPTPNDSLSSSAVATTLPTPIPPTITNPPVMHDQTLDPWTLQGIANQFYSSIVPSSSSTVVGNTKSTPTPTTPAVNFPNRDGAYHWKQNTMANNFSSNIDGSSSSVINTNNINHSMQTPNNPPKASHSSKNWPILTLPGYGKLSDQTPTHKQHRQTQKQQTRVQRRQESLNISKHTEIISQRQQHALDISTCTKINAQNVSDSNERNKEKRTYKMPLESAKNDEWSWIKYGEKSTAGSPYPREYYKCSFSECVAKKRMQQNKSNPNIVTITYIGCHNHPMPKLMNYVVTGTNSSQATAEDTIFEGLESFLDLENTA
ncbi:putative transcription factor WRKY family [Helianthus annuus]|nr:putative transcription factor WRKY family [Helianthus annuus]